MFVDGLGQNEEFYNGPYIDAYCQVWFHLAKRFQRRRLKCEKLTDGRTTDAKWWQKLTWPLARWAKKLCYLEIWLFGPFCPFYLENRKWYEKMLGDTFITFFYKESFRKNPIKIRSEIKKFKNLGRGLSCPPYNSKTIIDKSHTTGYILQDFSDERNPIKIGCKMIKFLKFFVKTPFGPTPLNGSSWNPQNQYQPLFS